MRWLLVVLALAGCDILDPLQYEVPPGTRYIEPPAIYAQWHAEVVECTGVAHGFADILWYEVPGPYWQESTTGLLVYGLHRGIGRIYLASGIMHDERIVKHELVHAVGFRGRGLDVEPVFVACSGIGHHG